VDEIVRQARAYLPLSFDPSLLTRDNLRSAAVAGDRAYAYSQTSYSLSDAPNFSRSEPNSQTQNESGSRWRNEQVRSTARRWDCVCRLHNTAQRCQAAWRTSETARNSQRV